jgi:hypothetical protein
MERIDSPPWIHVGSTYADKTFTDLDLAKDIILLPEMLEVLIQSLETMDEEARQLGYDIAPNKIKIHTTI